MRLLCALMLTAFEENIFQDSLPCYSFFLPKDVPWSIFIYIFQDTLELFNKLQNKVVKASFFHMFICLYYITALASYPWKTPEQCGKNESVNTSKLHSLLIYRQGPFRFLAAMF